MDSLSQVPELAPRVIHVWRIPLDVPLKSVNRLARLLSVSEQERADRFVKETDQQRFIVSHAALRTILGQYLVVDPIDIEMSIRPGGKPELAASHSSTVQFNLSHSYGLGMVAVVLENEVGIDVEQIRSSFDIASIVTRFFSQRETAKWQRLAEREKTDAFFRCWTRKEAYLKARGIGLSLELDQFEVAFGPEEPAELLWSHDDADDSVPQWCIRDVSPDDEYVAACVVEREVERVLEFNWTAHHGEFA